MARIPAAADRDEDVARTKVFTVLPPAIAALALFA
jgi:hypothetical protein